MRAILVSSKSGKKNLYYLKELDDAIRRKETEDLFFRIIYNKVDILTGEQTPQVNKMIGAISYFCTNTSGVFTFMMNKLLWYADMQHFKLYGKSICPLLIEETQVGDYIGNLVRKNPEIPMDITEIFSDSEIMVMSAVKNYFGGITVKNISDMSQEEEGYRHTKNGQFISYAWADKLKYLPVIPVTPD